LKEVAILFSILQGYRTQSFTLIKGTVINGWKKEKERECPLIQGGIQKIISLSLSVKSGRDDFRQVSWLMDLRSLLFPSFLVWCKIIINSLLSMYFPPIFSILLEGL